MKNQKNILSVTDAASDSLDSALWVIVGVIFGLLMLVILFIGIIASSNSNKISAKFDATCIKANGLPTHDGQKLVCIIPIDGKNEH